MRKFKTKFITKFMKKFFGKFMSIIMCGAMVISVAACNRTATIRDDNYGLNQSQGTRLNVNPDINPDINPNQNLNLNPNPWPNYGTMQGTIFYKDGTYTGEGNKTQYGNETAMVDISNGRIVNIVLRRVDSSGKEIAYDNASGNALMGGNTNTNIGVTAGGDSMGSSVREDGIGTGTTNVGGTARSTTPNLTQSRTTLINAMIQAQSYNVSTDNLSNSDIVNNWKLAVQRALDKAR